MHKKLHLLTFNLKQKYDRKCQYSGNGKITWLKMYELAFKLLKLQKQQYLPLFQVQVITKNSYGNLIMNSVRK